MERHFLLYAENTVSVTIGSSQNPLISSMQISKPIQSQRIGRDTVMITSRPITIRSRHNYELVAMLLQQVVI